MPLFPCNSVLEYASTSAVAGIGQLSVLGAVPKWQAAHTRIALVNSPEKLQKNLMKFKNLINATIGIVADAFHRELKIKI